MGRSLAMGRACAALAVGALMTAPAAGAADRTGVVSPAASFTWSGAPVLAGMSSGNTIFDPVLAQPCGTTTTDYCDATHLHVEPGASYAASVGGIEIAAGAAAGDLDLYVYRSDVFGAVGELVVAAAGPAAAERVAVPRAAGHYLVLAVAFAAAPGGSYDGRAAFYERAAEPPDVDAPAGLRDVPVTDPAFSARGVAQPALARSPRRRELLVAATRRFNADQDALIEYESKVGTSVSFDGGRRWTDLGVVRPCRWGDTPPEPSPCYPIDDPRRAGTGPEDAGDGRPGGDEGEEHTTASPSLAFADDGDAYLLLTDAPPYPGGNGWGVTLHRWRSPSQSDVARDRTWGRRVVVDTVADRRGALDDRPVLAIARGAGAPMVACWVRNWELERFGRQAILCKRATDRGRSWPEDAVPLTDARNGDAPYGPYVGGLDLASDPGRDGAFHVVWVDLGAGVTDGSGLAPLWHARSTDGGRSWQPPTLVTRFRPPPHRFARDAFRNVVLPSLAVGRRGAVHVAFAAQETTGGAGHADVRVVGSQDGGTSWTAPVTVNQDGGASDQFQPSLSAARDVLDVAFLDRRLDGVSIDQYLARSADGGRTWVETRLSHDSWDPAINPPRSPTGEVIGDQQAIVSDGCETVVVGVDTHMANAESRDAPMDGRRPRSRHQQAHAWRLPADAPWNEPSCGNG